MQNLVLFIEPSEDASNISAKAAMMYLNRFCIEEEFACELTGVYHLKSEEPLNFTLKQKVEGKYLKLRTPISPLESERPRIPNNHQYDKKDHIRLTSGQTYISFIFHHLNPIIESRSKV